MRISPSRFIVFNLRRLVPLLAAGLLGAAQVPVLAQAPVPSQLWGRTGADWSPAGRLPAFSHAGYHAGEAPIPLPPVVASVKQFGAVGDGVADDTQAFISAIAATAEGAILVPAGKYRITRVIELRKSRIVLRGEGPGKSILVLPRSLTDAAPDSGLTGKWPYEGGFVWVEGEQQGQAVARVTEPAQRGADRLVLDDASQVQPGQQLRLVQLDDAAHTLVRHMQGGQPFQSDQIAYLKSSLPSEQHVQDWLFKVRAVEGQAVVLDRPLRIDVRPEWQPELRTHRPTVQEVGIENLGFHFPGQAKASHNNEKGFNAVMFKQVSHGWVRNVEIVDADYAINARAFVYNSQFEDITIRKEARRADKTCHHGLNASIHSQDNLFQRYRFTTECVHDLTVEAFANGNVFSNGEHKALTIDHHKAAPYENLFTNLYTSEGGQLFNSGGAEKRGPNAGVRETLWNIQSADALQALKELKNYPELVVVGLRGYQPRQDKDRWVEAVDAAGVTPPNLHESQLARRLGLYEAETAAINGAVARTVRNLPSDGSLDGASGGGFVDFANASGDWVEWTVSVPQTGSYELSLRYANGGTATRRLALSVDGADVAQALAFKPTGNWSTWGLASTRASLPKGEEVKIRLRSTGSIGPDIDSLQLRPL